MLFESGGMDFDAKTQALYAGTSFGRFLLPLDASRMRYLGGGSNHWGGWCRPLDPIDFEQRAWLPYSGWPFGIDELEPYFKRAQDLRRSRTLDLRQIEHANVRGCTAPRARRRRRLHKLVPVQQDAQQRPANAFRRPLCRRSEAHRKSQTFSARQRNEFAPVPRCREPRQLRHRHAQRAQILGEAEDDRSGAGRDRERAPHARFARRGCYRRRKRE